MEILLYIISAIICHFVVETFIQSKETRNRKSEIDNISVLRKYAMSYAFFTGVVSMVIMCGIGIVYTDPMLFFCASLTGFVYYTLMYIMSVRVTSYIKFRLDKIEEIHVQWFINIMSIMLFLTVLNYITQI